MLAGEQGVAMAVHVVTQIMEWLTFFQVLELPAIGLAGLVAALVCGVLEWKRSWFFHLFCPLTAAALATALAEAIRRESARRTDNRLLAQSSYEALRRQNEQVMMPRHDIVKHFRVLRQTITDEKSAAYLDDLIGENEKIRPVIQSGNEMLDVILNGKLSTAADAGIAVELARTQPPDKLHMTDAELC